MCVRPFSILLRVLCRMRALKLLVAYAVLLPLFFYFFFNNFRETFFQWQRVINIRSEFARVSCCSGDSIARASFRLLLGSSSFVRRLIVLFCWRC